MNPLRQPSGDSVAALLAAPPLCRYEHRRLPEPNDRPSKQGYGHGRPGTRLRVANRNPGVAANDVTDETLLDELSGTTRMNGVPVTIHPVEAEPEKVPAGTSHAYDTR